MKVAVVRERRPNEPRVAASAPGVKKLIGLGLDVLVESGAGSASSITDNAFAEAGAMIVPDETAALSDADIVLKVQAPLLEGPNELDLMKSGAVLVGMLSPFDFPDLGKACEERGITAFALEQLPRITRAQTMDVLTSQSNLAGYRAVIEAAADFDRLMPMMMSAAGTSAPAKVFVMGAGVAGLQAIATARRLGAVVLATDVRPVVREQVESLGAKFVGVEDAESEEAETAGGYAREMSADYQARQAELIAETVTNQDIVVTTALIPGKPAPVLVTEAMVRTMKPGSVIVDLGADRGGNCELTRPGEIVVVDGVRILGHLNMPGRVATDASSLLANNLVNFVALLIDDESQELRIDWTDEIICETAISGRTKASSAAEADVPAGKRERA